MVQAIRLLSAVIHGFPGTETTENNISFSWWFSLKKKSKPRPFSSKNQQVQIKTNLNAQLLHLVATFPFN